MSRGADVVELVMRGSGLRAPTVAGAATASGAPGFVCSGRLPAGEAVAFQYSNTGYVCLAEIVRRIGGAALGDLARHRVFGPLGMTGSRLGGPPAARHPGLPAPPGTVGDGGWWTTAADLLRWLRAMNARTLGEEVTRILETPGRLDDGTPLSYAWGVAVSIRAGGVTFTHGGNWPGWSAKTVRQPGRARP